LFTGERRRNPMTVKGSWQRPVDKQKFESNFDRIFGVKKEKKEKPEEKKDDTARKNS
jgi:hypothetical protein